MAPRVQGVDVRALKGLLWVRYSKEVPQTAVQAVIDQIAPYFKDHGIELIVVPKAFEVMDKDEVLTFLAHIQEMLEADH